MNLNQRDPNKNFTRPIPTWSEISNPRNTGYANYNALQARYEQRFLAGLTLLNSFTYSKSMDNDSGSQDSNGPSPQDALNPAAEYAQSDYNQPLVNTLSLVYELPFGRGRSFLNSGGILNQITGGWQVSAINQSASGTPFNVTYGPSSANQVSPGLSATNRGANQYRPNRSSGVPLTRLVKNGNNVQFLNLAAVSLPSPTTSTGALASPFGSFGRNAGLGPSYFDTDVALNKSFGGTSDQGLRVQFRAEAYNLFNHTNFAPVGGGISGSNPVIPASGINPCSTASGSFAGTCGLSGGTISSTYPARILQFGLKVNY